ncbi:Acetyltransferase (GNAT) family protein [Thiothrix caldifontis]|uniref:Acetyltransferase (GNAT) family protein n=1 Tax=Thiothrix caldifontis TaxID=525918 RepID=A0A1H4D4T6_9GAMM|nr:GNAT family N-acetyltransferase [Thiothrix caldifontis]SEA67292.1 Acetyltransferase (GNAT) family protein [Thiothrix caldifontis]
MQHQRIPMTVDEYHLMEQPFGYKVEYWDDHAVITPRENHVVTQLRVVARVVSPACRLVALDTSRQQEMAETFFAAFHDTVEFCDWNESHIREFADRSISGYFAGKRGVPHPASVMALAQDGSIIGLALLLTDEAGDVCLDLLCVVPAYQRQKIATSMVATAVNQLSVLGVETLSSVYHICNESSRDWHHRFGFVDVYDQMYIRLKYAWYRNEVWRRDKLGLFDGLDALKAERDFWLAQLDESSSFG